MRLHWLRCFLADTWAAVLDLFGVGKPKLRPLTPRDLEIMDRNRERMPHGRHRI